MSDRRPIIVGNWKMNTLLGSATELAVAVSSSTAGLSERVDVGVCPPLLYVAGVSRALCDSSSKVLVGSQNAYHEPKGAFTGEVSVEMLKDAGAQMAIIGHSERRHVLGERDELINKKVRAVLDGGLMCILCIGELLEERERGETDAVNERQLRKGLEGVPAAALDRLVVAYEPVWAIGTGKTATPDDAQDAHAKCRAVLADLFGGDAAGGIRIQYGGSMKAENAADLLAQQDIDGGLIGGASLKAETFLPIVEAAAAAVAS